MCNLAVLQQKRRSSIPDRLYSYWKVDLQEGSASPGEGTPSLSTTMYCGAEQVEVTLSVEFMAP